MSRTAIAPRPPTQRSAVTNGKRMLLGVKGNTVEARRYRDLVEALTADLGAPLVEAERLHIRNVATLQFHAEHLTAALVRGEAVDAEELTRATNGATRALAALYRGRKAQKGRASTPTLDALKARQTA